MKYYPVFLDIKGKKCLVVGGGKVGARKAFNLAKANAKVTVISDKFLKSFESLGKKNIKLKKRKYKTKDIQKQFLVFAATNNKKLNFKIKKDASKLSVLCNVADNLKLSSFILPSIVDRKDLILAVSTSGASPAMAKIIRQKLESIFGDEYAKLLLLMKNIRKEILLQKENQNKNSKLFFNLIGNDILNHIKENNENKINQILKDNLGKGYEYKNLIKQRKKK